MNTQQYAKETFRDLLERFRQENELTDIRQPVDIRHIATLVDQAKTALMFHTVIGHDIPEVSGNLRTRPRATMTMDCETYGQTETKLQHNIEHPIEPTNHQTAPQKEGAQCSDGA